jgi:hypothetical protein
LIKAKSAKGPGDLTRISKPAQWRPLPQSGIAYVAKGCPLELDTENEMRNCLGRLDKHKMMKVSNTIDSKKIRTGGNPVLIFYWTTGGK